MEKERKTERKIPIGISMPQSLLNQIDTKRNKQSRSEFVVEIIEKTIKPNVQEKTTFAILKFEHQTGTKIGEYEVTCKASNSEDKWTQAYNVLRNSNATIKNRYHGVGYEFSYWLYRADKIYRQQLKPKTC